MYWRKKYFPLRCSEVEVLSAESKYTYSKELVQYLNKCTCSSPPLIIYKEPVSADI